MRFFISRHDGSFLQCDRFVVMVLEIENNGLQGLKGMLFSSFGRRRGVHGQIFQQDGSNFDQVSGYMHAAYDVIKFPAVFIFLIFFTQRQFFLTDRMEYGFEFSEMFGGFF